MDGDALICPTLFLEILLEQEEPSSVPFASPFPEVLLKTVGEHTGPYLCLPASIVGKYRKMSLVVGQTDFDLSTPNTLSGLFVTYLDKGTRRLLSNTEGTAFVSSQPNAIYLGLMEQGKIGLIFTVGAYSQDKPDERSLVGIATTFSPEERYKGTPFGYKDDFGGLSKALDSIHTGFFNGLGINIQEEAAYKLMPSV